MRIEDAGLPEREVAWSPRIGITVGVDREWRCYAAGSAAVVRAATYRRCCTARDCACEIGTRTVARRPSRMIVERRPCFRSARRETSRMKCGALSIFVPLKLDDDVAGAQAGIGRRRPRVDAHDEHAPGIGRAELLGDLASSCRCSSIPAIVPRRTVPVFTSSSIVLRARLLGTARPIPW